jgi:hypothetical protein
MTWNQGFETGTEVISTTATVADGEVVGGQTEFNNSTGLHGMAVAVINIPDTFGAAPTGPIDLYMVRAEIDGTNDGTALGYAALTTTDNQTDPEYAEYLGSWNPDQDEAYRDHINISLIGVKKAKYYIHNQTNTTLVYSASAITVDIIPISQVDA